MDKELRNGALEAALLIDNALLKVPFEQLTKAFRNAQKIVERELQTVLAAVEELVKKPGASGEKGDIAAALTAQLARAQHLQRKLQEVNQEEQQCLYRMEARLDHLQRLLEAEEAGSKPLVRHFHRLRLERIVIDYLLREGFYETALALAEDSDLSALVDVDLFLSCRKVEDALQRQSCTECLQWCIENRAKLRKIKSSLEFQIRLQEFVELVRAGQLIGAVTHARKHLTVFMDTYTKEIQQSMALLAFSDPSTPCERYQQLYSKDRWQQLIEQFRADNYALYSLSPHSNLAVTLQAGISALKTPMCSEPDDRSLNCPICDPTMARLAKDLPCAHFDRALLVCRITGKVMDADNPPMMLPNGNVYSTEGTYTPCH